jgi:hypothetical protein
MSLPARLAFTFLLGFSMSAHAVTGDPKPAPDLVTFEKDLAPLLAARCQPCHFPGGKMYAKLPFDRAETVRLLGTKLFTRLKDEPTQNLVRAFLAAPPPKR